MLAKKQVGAHAAVARLREAGAIFIGKTTLPELGSTPLTDSPLTGITRNPWNLALHAGGSSGGAFGSGMLLMLLIALRRRFTHHN